MKTHIFYLTRQQHKLLENRWKIQRYGDFDCGQTSCLDRQTCVRRLPRINMAAALMYRSNEQQQTMWYLHVPIGGTVGSYLYLPLLPHASLQTLRLYFNRTQHVSILSVYPDPAGEVDSPCGSTVQVQRSQRLYQHFLTDAASGLTFSHDNAVDLDAGGVSYSQADFRQLYRPTGALKLSAKRHKTQERKLCRLAQRPEGRQAPPERFRDLLPLLESADPSPVRLQTVELMQDSCSRTRATAASSAGHHLKRASGLAKPVHKAAHQDHIILDNSSKYHKNLQRWSSPAPQRWTGLDKMAAHPNQSQ